MGISLIPASFADAYWGNLQVDIEKSDRISGPNSDVIIVKAEFANDDDEKITIYPFYVRLDDNKGREFSTSTNYDLNEKGYDVGERDCPYQYSIDLNPGISDDGRFCFEVPKEDLTFALHIYEHSIDWCKNPSWGSCQEKTARLFVTSPSPEPYSPSSGGKTDLSSLESNADIIIAPGSSVPGCEETRSCYIPNRFDAGKGSVITWENMDTAAHTITSGKGVPSGLFDSSLIGSGQTFSHKFEKDDVVFYFCMVHPWMEGTINITRSGIVVGSQPGSSPNSSSKDITPPKMLKPNDIVMDAETSNGAKVTFEVLALDDTDQTVRPSCNPSSGSLFSVGTTTVKCNTVDSSGNRAIPVTFTVTVNPPEIQIPNWVKNIATFWCEDSIDDKSFVEGIQYLIENKIIVISSSPPQKNNSEDIPSWIKNNACWWGKGSITDSDFASGIKYLVENGIIAIGENQSIDTKSPQKNIQTTSPVKEDPNILTNDKFDIVFSDPENYKGKWAKLRGEVTQKFKEEGVTAFVFDTSQNSSFDLSKRIWVLDEVTTPLNENQCYTVEGKILGGYDAEFLLTGASRTIPAIELEKYEKMSCLDAKYPAISAFKPDEVQIKGNTKITIKQVVITNDHTRIFLEIENMGAKEGISFYEFNTVIIQDKRQFKPTYLFGIQYDDLETKIPNGVIEDGYIIMDPIQAKSFKLILEATEQNGSGFSGYVEQKFEFDFNPKS